MNSLTSELYPAPSCPSPSGYIWIYHYFLALEGKKPILQNTNAPIILEISVTLDMSTT
jgi:hypothetical protein